MALVDEYFRTARERYSIKLKRERGLPAPWTTDPVLSGHRFCNVHREDDRATVWLRDHIREPMRDQEGVLFGICAFRFFNRIETAEVLVKNGLHIPQYWNPVAAEGLLKDLSPIVGGAYVVHTPNNMGLNKLQGVIYMLNHVRPDCVDMEKRIAGANSMETAVTLLQVYPSVGKFVAYQIAADLRYTWVLENATDIMTWAQIGPGSSKGLGWVFFEDPSRFSYSSARDTVEAQAYMRELLGCSTSNEYWPPEWPAWDMQTVQNWLCEFSKYRAGLRGERLKRKYP